MQVVEHSQNKTATHTASFARMQDALLYALVARGTTVLVEHSSITGNANLVAGRILEKLPQGQSHMSFAQAGPTVWLSELHGLS